MVGREAELATLSSWFGQVKTGTRRVIFVSGEPGIGKTTLVTAFLRSIAGEKRIRIARGQCVEQYGAGEPYMPVLEGLTRLCREPGGESLLDILHRLAPAWLAQMPSLIGADDRVRLQGQVQGTTRDHMLREIVEALDTMASEWPLVLFIEDLHWSDVSTLELLSALGRDSAPAHLLVIGTYRPGEVLTGDHPFRTMKQELELHSRCEELQLKLLNKEDVAAYLTLRHPEMGRTQPLARVAPLIYERTEGNPLFMVNIVDYLVTRGGSIDPAKIETPRNIQQMIECNLERLSHYEQRVLESASVAGTEFSAAAVAASMERPIGEIEACFARLSHRAQFVSARGESTWPDGTVASTVRFLHALYRDVLYDRVPAGRRIELHRFIAQREEAAYGEQAGEIATELADHYRRANENDKSIRHFQVAGERAELRGSSAEAERHYNAALQLLSQLREGPDRDRRELVLQIRYGVAILATRGWYAPEFGEAYKRAQALCACVREDMLLFSVLSGLWSFHLVRGEHLKSREYADQMLALTSRLNDDGVMVQVQWASGATHFFMGQLGAAHEAFVKSAAHYDMRRHKTLASGFGQDPCMSSLCYDAITLWLLGFCAQAQNRANEALSLARGLNHPFSLAWCLSNLGKYHVMRRDYASAEAVINEALGLCTEHNFGFYEIMNRGYRGIALALQGRLEEFKENARLTPTPFAADSVLSLTYIHSALAESFVLRGKSDKAAPLLDSAAALVRGNHERYVEAEVERIRGEAALQRPLADAEPQNALATGESLFRRAMEIADAAGARILHLRAALSLGRLLVQKGANTDAAQLVEESYLRFSEGFDAPDLVEARIFLDKLRHEACHREGL